MTDTTLHWTTKLSALDACEEQVRAASDAYAAAAALVTANVAATWVTANATAAAAHAAATYAATYAAAAAADYAAAVHLDDAAKQQTLKQCADIVRKHYPQPPELP